MPNHIELKKIVILAMWSYFIHRVHMSASKEINFV